MTKWNRLDATGKGLVIGALAAVVCVVVVACSMMQRPAAPPQTADTTSPRRPVADPLAVPAPAGELAEAAPSAGVAVGSEPSIAPDPPEPLSPEAIATLRAGIKEASEDYRARLEARRSLLHGLRKHGQLDLALPELEALLDDVEGQEGPAKAQRVAFAEGGNLQSQGDYCAAIGAYEQLLGRYGDGRFAAEAMYHLGGCHLELQEYAAAERVWQRLIEGHDDSSQAPWGWRKLALAQLLQGEFDTALSTLEVMAAKYADTHFGEYARMRRGYVQVAAGRFTQARATYEAFLGEFPHSKYVRLVGRQMGELEEAVPKSQDVLARVNGLGE